MKNKIKWAILGAFCSLTIASAQSSLLVNDVRMLALKADSLLEKSIMLGDHVGISGGIYGDGQVLWANGAGWSDREAGTPMTTNSVLRIASITKSMTAVGIMQLAEKGMIDLDEPIQAYVPQFPIKPEGTITVRHLLTHTSGIRHYQGTRDGFSRRQYPDLPAALKRFQDRDLAGEPGKVYQYSTYGYVLLGAILEKVSGMTYEHYMQKHIWGPAGMVSTSVEHQDDQVDHKSRLYRISKKRKLKKDLNTNLSMKIPGGGVQSTAEDLLHFGEALMAGKLLKPETLNLMLTDPGIRKEGNPYGMGWFLYSTAPGNRIIGHSGSQAGASSQLLILLDKKAVVTCLSNTRGGWNDLFDLTWRLAGLF